MHTFETRVQFMSDLHLEFHPDFGESFIKSLDATGVDVLCLAGDIDLHYGIEPTVDQFCKKFPHVIYVLGNHEYYRSTKERVHKILEDLEDKHENFHWLHNSTVKINGIVFAGTPLWFRDQPMNSIKENLMADFSVIHGDFRTWVYEENEKALQFLEGLADADEKPEVVITHHLPTIQSVSPRFLNGHLNCFFACDVEDKIYEISPVVWHHGHTHDSLNYKFSHTRIVCNPLSYFPHYNKIFDPGLIIRIGRVDGARAWNMADDEDTNDEQE